MAQIEKFSFITSAEECNKFVKTYPKPEQVLLKSLEFFTVGTAAQAQILEPNREITPYSSFFITKIKNEFGFDVSVGSGYM